jgi:MFS family permease
MFGEIYGYFFMIFALGTAVGPAAAGAMFQMAGSYQPALIGAGVVLVIATVGINLLGTYAYPVEHGRETIEFGPPREPA